MVSQVCLCVCVHVKNPFLTVLRVVSLNTPAKTAPAGSNPFEDDDEEEEEQEEEVEVKQQTTVNHIIVNKEDIKTLVNRSRHCSLTSFLLFFPLSLFGLKELCSPPFVFITLLPSSLKSSLLPQVAGRCVDLHGQWNEVMHSQCASVLRS